MFFCPAFRRPSLRVPNPAQDGGLWPRGQGGLKAAPRVTHFSSWVPHFLCSHVCLTDGSTLFPRGNGCSGEEAPFPVDESRTWPIPRENGPPPAPLGFLPWERPVTQNLCHTNETHAGDTSNLQPIAFSIRLLFPIAQVRYLHLDTFVLCALYCAIH